MSQRFWKRYMSHLPLGLQHFSKIQVEIPHNIALEKYKALILLSLASV